MLNVRIFNLLARLFREGRIGFPADAGEHLDSRGTLHTGLLKQELVAFEYDAERAGHTKFGTQSSHDDVVYGTTWAASAAGAAHMRTRFAKCLLATDRHTMRCDGETTTVTEHPGHTPRVDPHQPEDGTLSQGRRRRFYQDALKNAGRDGV